MPNHRLSAGIANTQQALENARGQAVLSLLMAGGRFRTRRSTALKQRLLFRSAGGKRIHTAYSCVRCLSERHTALECIRSNRRNTLICIWQRMRISKSSPEVDSVTRNFACRRYFSICPCCGTKIRQTAAETTAFWEGSHHAAHLISGSPVRGGLQYDP